MNDTNYNGDLMGWLKSKYNCIGKRIKNFAIYSCIIESIIVIISGIVTLCLAEDGFIVLIGLIMIIVGPILCFMSTWILYGFGEIVDTLYQIRNNILKNTEQADHQTHSEFERRQQIEKLYSQGLITEEEYKTAISKQV